MYVAKYTSKYILYVLGKIMVYLTAQKPLAFLATRRCKQRCRESLFFSVYTKFWVYVTLHASIGQNIGKELVQPLMVFHFIHEANAELPTGFQGYKYHM
jgi:hypothetical protein